jgi:hypothetical protein
LRHEQPDLLVDLVLGLARRTFLEVCADAQQVLVGQLAVDELEKPVQSLLALPLRHGAPP